MKYISTFSIAALDPETGELGVAVQSKFLAVGNAVGWAKAGVGAIATQALANLDFGEIGLKLLEKGYSAEKTLQTLLALDDNREDRQGTLAVEGETANKIQKALKELGYYQGDITGSYDESTKKAYFDFCGIENFEERICEGNFVDKKVLEFLLNKAANI